MKLILSVRDEIEEIVLRAKDWATEQENNPNLTPEARGRLGDFKHVRPAQWVEIVVNMLKDEIGTITRINEAPVDTNVYDLDEADELLDDFLEEFVRELTLAKLHVFTHYLSTGSIWKLKQCGAYEYELIFVGMRSILEPAIRQAGGSFKAFLKAIDTDVSDEDSLKEQVGAAIGEIADDLVKTNAKLTDRVLGQVLVVAPKDHEPWEMHKLRAGHEEVIDEQPPQSLQAAC